MENKTAFNYMHKFEHLATDKETNCLWFHTESDEEVVRLIIVHCICISISFIYESIILNI